MKPTLLCVGHKPPKWVAEGVETYEKRLKPGLVTVLLAPSRAQDSASRKQQEATALTQALPKSAFVVGLDERGEHYDSRGLAQAYAKWQRSGRPLVFVVGGADGLCDSFVERCDALWSLSRLTLPHALVRVFVCEAMYRSQALLSNHPYHRD